MKLFKSSIFAVLGLAVALTACSDDKDHPDYSPAGASAGAYFANGSPKEYLVKDDMSAFDVTVYRTKDAGSSYEVTAVDTSGLFTVPSSVTFTDANLSSQLSIAFDAAKLVEEVDYSLTLNLAQASSYGQSTYTFVVRKGSPMVVESIGTGDYTYDALLVGLDPGLPVTRSYMPATPYKQTFVVSEWFYGEPLTIVVPDLRDNEDGRVPVFVSPSFTGYVDKDGYDCYAIDCYSYFKDIYNPLQGETALPPYDASYYEPEKGLFTLCLIYYAPAASGGLGVYTQEPVYEYFQLEGFPDYSLTVTYDGLFIKKNGNMFAQATLTVGPDVEEVKTVLVEGKDAEKGLDLIKAGDESVQTLEGVGTLNAEYAIEAGGDYTIVAASYAEGELQVYVSDSFNIELNDDSADWDNIGTGSMMDGWIMAAFSKGGQVIDVSQYPFAVPIQQHKQDKQLYRLVKPYGPNYPLYANNEYPSNRNIQFHLAEDMIFMQPQPSGFGAEGLADDLVIGNWAGYVEQQNPDVSYADLKAFIIMRGWEIDEYSEDDGYAMIIEPMHEGSTGFGYVWKVNDNIQPSYIFMPTASESTKAKLRAKQVAAPVIKGLATQAVRASKVHRQNKARVPHLYDSIKPLRK